MAEETKKKEPQIRFKGFSEEWEKKTLGDEAIEIIAGGDVRKNKLFDSGKYPVLANALSNDGILGYYKEEFRVKAPAVTVTGRGDVGHAKARHTNFTPVVRLLSIKTKHNVNFVEHAINNHKVLIESTGVPQLTVPQLSNYDIYFPKELGEEKIIGTYFQKLDRLIKLHQQKHEKLVTLKKAMLKKMFPQNGAATPEIRFKGFSEPWKEKILGEMAHFSKGQGYSKGDLVESGAPIVLYGRLYTDYQTTISEVDTFVFERKGAVKSTGTEVIVPSSGETAEDIVRASAIAKSGLILGGDLNIILPSSIINSCFLALTISNGKPQKELAKRAQGKSVVHLRNSDLKEVEIQYPSIDEQQIISTYFREIDELIAQHKVQLTKLKQIKAACLEKMFV